MNSFEPNDQQSPQTKFAITQLKFKSESYDRLPKTKSLITTRVSQQNWNKNFIVRQHRKKMRPINQGNKHFGLLEEQAAEAKNNMFMAWKDRHFLHIKLSSSKVQTETSKSIKKTQSERKLPEVPQDLELRRLTALPKQRQKRQQMYVGAQLMAQKLECQGRVTHRMNPSTQGRWSNRAKCAQLNEKSAIIKLSGWQYGQNQYELDLL